jgi:hypothetical protein
VTVTLSASDGSGSGVYLTYLDGTQYTGPRLYMAEGATTIAYQSNDSAGNTEELQSLSFYIDTLPPTSTIVEPATSGQWTSLPLTLAGISEDPTSGVASVEVSLNGGVTWLPATGGAVWAYSWDTSTTPEGLYTVQVRGIDQAGNVEAPRSLLVGVDRSSPLLDVGAFPSSHSFACSGPMTFALTASDHQSGINNTAIVVRQNGVDARVLKAPGGELLSAPIVWDGRDEQGNPVPPGDYQLLFYTANFAGLFGSYGASLRVEGACPPADSTPVLAPVFPAAPPLLPTQTPPPTPTPAPQVAAVPGGGNVSLDPPASVTGNVSSSQPSGSITTRATTTTSRTGGNSTAAAAGGLGAAALLGLAGAFIAGKQAAKKNSYTSQLPSQQNNQENVIQDNHQDNHQETLSRNDPLQKKAQHSDSAGSTQYHSSESIQKDNPPVEALVAIGILLTVVGLVFGVATVVAEIALAPLAATPQGMAAEALLIAADLILINVEVAWWTYTYRVAQAGPNGPHIDINFNPLEAWGLNENKSPENRKQKKHKSQITTNTTSKITTRLGSKYNTHNKSTSDKKTNSSTRTGAKEPKRNQVQKGKKKFQ